MSCVFVIYRQQELCEIGNALKMFELRLTPGGRLKSFAAHYRPEINILLAIVVFVQNTAQNLIVYVGLAHILYSNLNYREFIN